MIASNAAAKSAVPDVVIWDVTGPSIDALPAEVPVLAVGPNSPEAMMEAIEAGAQGYLHLDSDPADIVEAALQVAGGTSVVSPLLLGPLLRAVVERRRQERSQRAALDVLTAREHEVFELAARGLSRAEVAEVLIISPDTARTHIQKVMGKLDLHSQAELVAFAASCGFDTAIEGVR
jgi:DNA-binding NarL/FixJ family response regulator